MEPRSSQSGWLAYILDGFSSERHSVNPHLCKIRARRDEAPISARKLPQVARVASAYIHPILPCKPTQSSEIVSPSERPPACRGCGAGRDEGCTAVPSPCGRGQVRVAQQYPHHFLVICAFCGKLIFPTPIGYEFLLSASLLAERRQSVNQSGDLPSSSTL